MWRQVTGVLCDRRMPNRLKAKIYRSVVRPVALNACECWPAGANHERALHAMKMRMLGWNLGLTRLDHVTNIDVRTQIKVAPITEKMRQARVRWYGHVMRRGKEAVVRTALHLDPAGRRPRGRPKKRWLNRINEDLHTVNLQPQTMPCTEQHGEEPSMRTLQPSGIDAKGRIRFGSTRPLKFFQTKSIFFKPFPTIVKKKFEI